MNLYELMNCLPAPRITVASGIALAHGLHAAKPENANEAVERYAAEMKAQAELVGRRWGAREKAAGDRAPNEARLADQRVDTCLRAIYYRLSAATLLSPERYPEAVRVQELVDSLFPEGLSFLNVRFDNEWAHVDKLLKRIDDEKLATTIETIAGAAYLAELRLSFEKYGQVLGKTQPRPDTESITIAEDLQKLSRCVSAYAVQVVATAEESRPESVEAARRALQPLIDYRAAMSRSRAADKKNQLQPEPLPVTE